MVTAIDAPASGFVNPKLADGEIQITRWLADDLGVTPGAKVTLKYFVMGERRQLIEKPRTFTVAAPILEMDTPQLDTSWMPDFPNVPDGDSFGKWKPGFDFDATRIRKQDEEYWKKYRGTPKAFVTLKTGQELWGNRWGNLTSIRYPAGTKREQVERIAAFIDPAALGFRTVNLREQALAATNAPVDFGELFVYFSFFLIAAAAVLTGLLFTFTIEQRAAEAGLLLAVGWPVKKVRRLFLREGFVLALIGSLVGALLAALYTKGVLHALASVWSGATGGTRFVFAPSAITIAIGTASGVFVAMIAMWLASRRLFKMEAAVLLNGEWSADANGAPSVPAATSLPRESPQKCAAAPNGSVATGTDGAPSGRAPRSVRSFRLTFTAIVSVVAALALAVLAKGNSGAFFGAGALLLIAGCLFALAALRKVATGTGADSLAQLGARNISRRRGRSMATIAVLASGVFMVIAVDSFRKAAPKDTTRRDTGTGGFAFIGESSAPIYEDLNSAKGREAYALDDKLMSGVRVVQMRVRDGDDASCLNLNRAVQPRILGVDFSELENVGAGDLRASGSTRASRAVSGASPEISGRGEASVMSARPTTPDAAGEGADGGARGRARSPFSLVWSGVKAKDVTAVPGVVDANTLQWAMQKKIGDVLEIPGERGDAVRVQFAATVDGSVLQGVVIIPERDFTAKFPNTSGTRFFLVDCPREKADAVREHLTRQLGDRGLELVSATKRLAEFNEVENTYLSIFQVLGGLGMLLGSAGLGIVVARNVFERRREFGLLEAVGFTPRLLRALVFAEHRWLIVGALGIGAVSALTAVWPRLSAQAAHFPWRGILTLIIGMALLGAFWAWLATRLALRRSQLAALRSE
ncbi:MAG: ABC transporter permease [Chthoniobacteraceae bacterium]